MKPILVSGIQPSGRLHIGNYFGALKNFVDLQNSDKYKCYFFIADLHSITESFDPKEKQKQILNLAADFLAAGLDPKKSTIFLQSQVAAHNELMWILNTITPIGELERMTQFKDKGDIKSRLSDILGLLSPDILVGKHFILNLDKLGYENLIKLGESLEIVAQILDSQEKYNIEDRLALGVIATLMREIFQRNHVNIGLFDYPVLMAADILLYGTNMVPVGDDQLQHIELTRTLARKFNGKFGKTFIEPKDLLTKTPRIMSLKNPEKKMSKSQPESCLFIDDSPEIIKEKISRATTDSGSEIVYNRQTKPGLSNLLDIYSAISGREVSEIIKDFSGKKYSEFKNHLADETSNYFANFRKKKKEVLLSEKKIKGILSAGSKKATKVANKKMGEVKEKIGLAL